MTEPGAAVHATSISPVIGILGGGQLGRMLALAAARLGVRTRCYDSAPDACAGQVCELHVGGFDDDDRLGRFALGADVVTYEFENVPLAAAERLARRVPVFPPPGALAVCQDRLEEKTLFRRLGIETAAFAPVATRAELDAAVDSIGLPSVLKTRRLGYDGKGQAVLRRSEDVERAWTRLGTAASETGLILEAFVPFQRELSIIACAGLSGGGGDAPVFYPLTENVHAEGILHISRAPAAGASAGHPSLQARAESLAARVLKALDYRGVLAIELFELDGRLLANEMAPRVHNSGHWTLDAPGVASQFENHIRAVLGLPLAPCALAPGVHAGMFNLVGELPPALSLDGLCGIPGAHVHLYGKQPREGRKVGHVNFTGASADVERGLTTLSTLSRSTR
ncbi:MAG: 5-(carboxyamino)imidazole ribonucleotide synthase [Phycisphaerales bacterium]